MVAIVSGNGLGLFNTSLTQLGTGLWGQAGIGQSRESQYVNVATGNLILQDLDELITVRGFDATFLRTYNSQGTVSGAGQDGFITGFERSLVLSGTLNAVGSTVVMKTGDGQSVTFTYSGTANQYVTTDGAGANDTLTWSGGASGTWTYVEGSSQRQEWYTDQGGAAQLSSATAYLKRIRNLKTDFTTPAEYNISYVSGLVSSVDATDASGTVESLLFTYTSGRLTQVQTRESGTLKAQVNYTYDGYGRLSTVATVLGSSYNAVNDVYDNTTASTFTVTYTYVAASASDLRVASVSDSDGTLVSYTYDGSNRISTVTQGSASDSSAQSVTFGYSAGSTTVTDSAGRVWTYQYDANKQLTAVIEPDGLTTTTYTYTITSDTGGAGNVKQIKVARSGTTLSQTDYSYDANGNLAWQWNRVDGATAPSTAVQRTYNSSNQLTSETAYSGLDSDGPGASVPTGGLTTNFIYDAYGRQLRFAIDASGAVRELTYATSGNAIGQVVGERRYVGAAYTGTMDLTSLVAWATATQKSSSQLIDYGYDAKGRMTSAVAYANVDASGNGVTDTSTSMTQYIYDTQGLLRQKIVLHGVGRVYNAAAVTGSEATNYVYDGMGRLLATVSRSSENSQTSGDATTIATTYAYIDSLNQIKVTTDGGAVRTETRNKAGLLTSVSEVGSSITRTSTNYYDATGRIRASRDASGATTYFFYEAISGRLSATVTDAGTGFQEQYSGTRPSGEVRKFAYDYLGRVIQTTSYATRIDTNGWLSGSTVGKDTLLYSATNPSPSGTQAWVQTDATNDRNAYRTYDALGRLATETTDSTTTAAQLTTYSYDGASRLLSVSLSSGGNTRTTRYFYDNAGRQLGVLDSEGYLSESIYDAGGRLIKTIGYATLTASGYWANGTLTQLRPAVANSDAISRFFYDAQGRKTGQLVYSGGTTGSLQGYLTEYLYNEEANWRGVRAYAKLLTALSGSEGFATLVSAANTSPPTEVSQFVKQQFNGLGQLSVETNAEGTTTAYFYDDSGRLIRTQLASNTSTEARDQIRRYDAFGNLVAEASGQGAAAYAATLGKTVAQLSAAELDAACGVGYGLRHSYDLVGRRIETLDQANNKTWYFYDFQGRSTFTIRGVVNGATINGQGEVTETRYNAFGQVSDQLAYTGRITIGGSQLRADVQTAVNALTYASATDTRRLYAYDRRGLLTQLTNAEGAISTYTYNGFGQVATENLFTSSSAALTVTHSYNNRGLEYSRVESYGALSRTTSNAYDAFGRAISAVDALGNTVSYSYDRMGRQVGRSQIVEGRTEAYATAYDAFSRVVSQTDALNKITTIAYSDANRTVSITTPELFVSVTTHNRFGQSVTVANGMGQASTFTYDKDGNLLTDRNALNLGTNYTYDSRGLLISTYNATGDVVQFSYDAARRLLTRVENPAGLALTTTFAYDGQGRQVSITDPANRLTTFSFDREGRLTQKAQDPAGLNLRTTYSYDAAGRVLTQVEGFGATNATPITTGYTYDAFGRRVTQVEGSGSLNLTTTYVYDANDNVVSRQDAAGNWTRFGYDQANRLRFSLDPSGSLTQISYDADGRVFKTRTYATLVNMAGVATTLTLAQLQSLATGIGTNAADQVEYRVYNADGQLRYRIDGAGDAVAFAYDAAGRNTIEKRYVVAIGAVNLPTALVALEAGTATIAQLGGWVPATAGQDQQITRTFDIAGRLIKQVDAAGAVTRFIYDDAGRQVATIDPVGAVTRFWFDPAGRHIMTRRFAALWTGATDSTTMTTLDQAMASSWTGFDQSEARVYDQAGNLRYVTDAANGWTEYTYDGAGRRVSSRVHADALVIDSALNARLWAGTAHGYMPVVANDASDRCTYWVYNELGQVRYEVNAAGYATAFGYDAAGRQTLVKAYSVPLNYNLSINASTVRACLTAGTLGVNLMASSVVSATAGKDRFTSTSLDGAGRARYRMTYVEGDLANVVEWRYDSAGHVSHEVQYAVRIAFAHSQTTTQVGAAITAAGGDAAANQRVTKYIYDGVGRVKTTTDNLNQVESYSYDAAGNRASYTNKLGAIWSYGYNAVGLMTSETSPSLSVARFDATGTVVFDTTTLLTTYSYNALGKVISKTENASAADLTERRTTTYEYDSRGLLTKTTYPIPKVVDSTGSIVAGSGPAPYQQISYNAFGQAVVQRDVLGRYSYKAYDNRGNLAYDVDASNYVTKFGYNAFGDQTTLTRYAAKVVPGWVAGTGPTYSQVESSAWVIANAANDRVMTMAYDLRGNRTSVTLSSVTYYTSAWTTATGSPQTNFQFDSYGNLVKESVLLDTGVWADTFHYYDLAGQRTTSVDSAGYVTTFQYTVLGQLASQTERARAISLVGVTTTSIPTLPVAGDQQTGYDRTITFSYDALGRKVGESTVRHFRDANGVEGSRTVTTTTEYDAGDRATASVVDGVRTETAYDVLGRNTSVTESARLVLASNWAAQLTASSATTLATAGLYITASPYTETAYDAFGNAVRVIRSVNGKQGGTVTLDPANDPTTIVRYDINGRVLIEQDAVGGKRYREYDAAGRTTKVWYRLATGSGSTWRVVANYAYDAVGNQITTQVTRQVESGGVPTGTVYTDSSEQARYNAFGELIAKGTDLNLGLADSALPEQFVYDKAGRLVSTNSNGGAHRSYGYDLAGRQLLEVRSPSSGTPAYVMNTVDALGRLVRQALPSYTTGSVTTYVHSAYDRWGNTLEVVDARGYRTSYEYNELNQAVRETKPLVKIVSDAGVETWARPESFWFYDALGRLVGSRDANGNIRQNTVDAAGRVVATRDATGAVTLSAFDVLGRQRASQNGLGYISTQSFDKLDRVTSLGDFLLDATGAVRTQQSTETTTAIQTYVLDIDGNRISITDRLAHTQLYDYDSRQLVLRSQSAAGSVVSYGYDLRGNKVRENTALWSSGSATTADRDGEQVRFDEKTWDYDYFGRAIDYNDLGKNDSNYSYDGNSGLLTYSDVSTGASRTITYYANGLVKQITQGDGSWYRYEYDANGNRTVEESSTTDGNNLAVRVLTRTFYDSHNRIERVITTDVNNSVTQLDIVYDYDANGNRRSITAQTGYKDTGNVSIVPITDPVATGAPPPVGLPSGVATQFRFTIGELFADPDGTALTYSARLVGGGALPSWLTMTTDLVKGQLVFSATTGSSADNNQLLRIEIVATGGTTATNAFSLMVGTDLAPVQIAAPNATYLVRTGNNLNLSFNVADYFADYDLGDELVLSLAGVSPSAAWLTSATVGDGVLLLSGTPAAGNIGTYQVTLKATDRMGASASMVVTVKVEAPVAPLVVSPLPARNIFSGRTFAEEIPLSQLFSDTAGDTLQITAAMADGKMLPPWMSFIVDRSGAAPIVRLDGYVPYTITSGTYQVRFTATDAGGLTTNTVLTLTVLAGVADSAPTGGGNYTAYFTAGQVNTYTLPAGAFTDVNGDYLNFSVMEREKIWEEVSPGDWISYWNYYESSITIDDLTRTITLPVASSATAYTIPDLFIWAADPLGRTGTVGLTINVAAGSGTLPGGGGGGNQAPIQARPVANQGAVVNQAWAFLLPAGTFTDPEGQGFSLAATLSSGAALPSWLTFDAATGLFKGTPPAGASSWTIKVTATDTSGASNNIQFTITSGAASSFTTGTGYGSLLSALGASRTRVTPPPGATVISQQYWYTYDGENRTVINQGHLYNGAISLQNGDPMVGYGPWYSGFLNIYDAAGNQTGLIHGATGGLAITRMLYTERGQLSVTFGGMPTGTYGLTQGTSLPWSVATERRFYDNAGRLSEIRGYFSSGALPVNGSGVGPLFVEVAGWLQHLTTFSYDNDNQVTTQAEYGRIGAHWVDAIMTAYSGNATTALVPQSTNTGVLSLLSTTTTTRNAAGRTSTMVYAQSNVAEGQAPYGVPLSFTHSYTYTDLKRDDYLENTIAGTSSDNNFKPSTSSSTYNAYGHRTAIKEDSKASGVEDQWRYFSYGADGQILSRYDGKWKNGLFDQGYTSNEQKSNRHHFSYVNGQMVGSVDHLGRMEVISQATAFDSGSLGTNQTTVQAGDTLESIAQRVYGNSSYWYVIASANGLHVDEDLSVGMNLKVPDVKTSKNDSSTFKPYNPAEIVGDTTPNLAYIAPPKAGCSAIATLVRIVIAIAIVMLMPPAGAAMTPGLLGTMGALAAGGEVFAQAVEITEDRRAGFDIGGIASAGLTAMAAGSMNFGAMGWAARMRTAASLAVSSRINAYAINRVLGREDHWNWRNVAVSAATAGITAGIFGSTKFDTASPVVKLDTGQLAQKAFNFATAAKIASIAVAKEAIGYGVRKAIVGEARWSWREVSAGIASDAASYFAQRHKTKLALDTINAGERIAAGGVQYVDGNDVVSMSGRAESAELETGAVAGQDTAAIASAADEIRRKQDLVRRGLLDPSISQEEQARFTAYENSFDPNANGEDFRLWRGAMKILGTHRAQPEWGYLYKDLSYPTPENAASWYDEQFRPFDTAAQRVARHDHEIIQRPTLNEDGVVLSSLKGAGDLVVGTAKEISLTYADLWQTVGAFGDGLITGRPEGLRPVSAMGRAIVQENLSTHVALSRLTPFYQVPVALFDIRRAYDHGDTDGAIRRAVPFAIGAAFIARPTYVLGRGIASNYLNGSTRGSRFGQGGGIDPELLVPGLSRSRATAESARASIAASGINPRLTQRLDAWRAYQSNGGELKLPRWVQQTQGAPWGTGFKSGYGKWANSVESVHGNSLLSKRPASLYEKFDADGNFLKWGIAQDMNTRALNYLGNGEQGIRLFEYASGSRSEMAKFERLLEETQPGPQNLQPWAIDAWNTGRRRVP